MDSQWKQNGKVVDKLPAIPPRDYEGTQAKWHTSLQENGFKFGQMIPVKDYDRILDECEK